MSIDYSSVYVLVAESNEPGKAPKFWSRKHGWHLLARASLSFGVKPSAVPENLPYAGPGFACRWLSWLEACTLVPSAEQQDSNAHV